MPMFSRQHYKAIAAVLAGMRPNHAAHVVADRVWNTAVDDLCNAFREDNPRFKEEVFRKACEQ